MNDVDYEEPSGEDDRVLVQTAKLRAMLVAHVNGLNRPTTASVILEDLSKRLAELGFTEHAASIHLGKLSQFGLVDCIKRGGLMLYKGKGADPSKVAGFGRFWTQKARQYAHELDGGVEDRTADEERIEIGGSNAENVFGLTRHLQELKRRSLAKKILRFEIPAETERIEFSVEGYLIEIVVKK